MSRTLATLAVCAALVCGLLAGGCGASYAPPELPTTGAPAGPLGQVLDVDVEFPAMRLMGYPLPGVEWKMRIEMERVGYGDIPARVYYESARVSMFSAPIVDRSTGRATITVTPAGWTSNLVGPIQVGQTTFGYVLDGVPSEDGWQVGGGAVAGQSLESGTFAAWRRHRFLVASTDFLGGGGRIEEVALVRESEVRVRHALELVSSDSVLSLSGGALFAVNRLGYDNLQRLDPWASYTTSWQAGAGGGANPQDVLLPSPDKGYVTRYEPPFNDIGIFDPLRGPITRSIPLAELAENPDHTPRPGAMSAAAGAVFVALQDIDRTFSRFGEGKLAVIDPVADLVAGVIPLGGKNPLAIQRVREGSGRDRLYVALAGIFPGLQPQELSGGVRVVDPEARASERWALDDDVAGGNVSGLAMADEHLGYVVVSDARFVNRVLAFDPLRAVVRRTVRESPDLVPQIAIDSKRVLAIPDRRFFEPQTCLYRAPDDPEDSETRIWCVTMELPPFSIVALD